MAALSRLDKLSENLIKNILRHLLSSEAARIPHKIPRVIYNVSSISVNEKFNFHTNILRVSKKLSKLAHEILYHENGVIKISMYFAQVIQGMENHDVAFFHHQSVKLVKQHIASVIIQCRRVPSTTVTQFLVLLDDLPGFCRFLRMLDFASFMCFSFDIKLERPSSDLAVQRLLLYPFKQLDGSAASQEVTITGFKTQLTRNVLVLMRSNCGWVRAAAWEVYDLFASFKEQADTAFVAGDYAFAKHRYGQAQEFHSAVTKMHTMIRDFDEEYENAWMHLDIIIYNNVILAGLLQKDWSRFLGEEEARDGDDKIFHSVLKYVSKSTESTGAYWRGLSALACKKPLLAKRFFKLAVKTAPDDALKAKYQAALLVACSWFSWTADERDARLASMIADLPRIPTATPPKPIYCSFPVASEKYILEKLGHHCIYPVSTAHIQPGVGVVLIVEHGRPRTAQVGEVMPAVLDPLVESYRKQMAMPGPGGCRYKSWVGLGDRDIGGTSVLDKPEGREMIARVAESMRATVPGWAERSDRMQRMWSDMAAEYDANH